jgi:multiple sugar transport system ATP-binding protein
VSASLFGLHKTFDEPKIGELVALDEVDLEALDGELMVIVGPSGSGKTTLLRCIAGLEMPDSGRIEVGGKDVTNLPPGARDVAMVFQDFALYPHLSARDNISFGLRAAKTPEDEIGSRVNDVTDLLGLEEALDRRPGELSGGERQRVALARAIVREPSLFLLDEPLSNLDAELRTTTRAEIRSLQRRLGTTAIYVTHDQVEAMTMGDRVAVLRAGRVEQVAPPTELYDSPATAFVARFLGSPPMNLFEASLYRADGGAGALGIRPEHLRVVDVGHGRMTGRVTAVELLGDVAIVHIVVGGHQLLAKVLRETAPDAGVEVDVAFEDSQVHEFDGLDGRAI